MSLTNGDVLVGEIIHLHTVYEDTFADLGEVYGLGYLEMVRANPGVDPWLPGDGTSVTLPTHHLLPSTPHDGIVVNLSEYRLYHFKDGKVTTYPVGIGTSNNPSPLTDTHVTMRLEQPAWYPPSSVRRQAEERGEILPRMIPPGPENPLGPFALLLEEAGYLIHGTNKRFGIGQQVSHGCIRMYNEDISTLVWEVERGTSVRIVEEPVKAGVQDGIVWLQVHGQSEELGAEEQDKLWQQTQIQLTALQSRYPGIEFNRAHLDEAVEKADGIPRRVGEQLPSSMAVHSRLSHETEDDDGA
ncbi:MAG: hypothetical protein EA349_15200 [Halomonadaceae bacterium]|nr:MAG: hypothetical protein EA349_15200 [Halomonadaceae bacterium]